MRTTSLSRRAALAGLGGALLAAPSLAAPSLAADPGLSGVTLRVADQAGATRSKLAAAGLLDDVPYRIEWSVFAAAVNIHEALKAGAADLGMAGSGPTIAALAGGSRLRIVAGWDTGGRETYLLVPPDSPVRRLEELRGRTVSPTGRGSAGHLIVVNALESVGLSASDVKLAFLSPADAGAAFSSGSIDAWGIWSTYAYRALGTRKARVLAQGTQFRPELYIVSATEAALADPGRTAALADFVARVERGHDWTRANREAHVAWYAGFVKQERAIAEQAYDGALGYRRVPVDDAFVARLEDTFATWKRAGVLDGTLDLGARVHRDLPLA